MLHPKHTTRRPHHRGRYPSSGAARAGGGKGLGDVEEAKKNESDERVTPIGAAAEEGDPLADDLVDDDECGSWRPIHGDDGGGGDAEEERESDAGEQDEEQSLRRGMQAKAKADQRRTAATEPQVPGPGLPNPAPKKVATVQAQNVLWAEGAG